MPQSVNIQKDNNKANTETIWHHDRRILTSK